LWIVIVRVSVFTIGLAGSVLAATSGLVDPDAVSGDARDQRTGDSPADSDRGSLVHDRSFRRSRRRYHRAA
jgi:hypothetical protein